MQAGQGDQMQATTTEIQENQSVPLNSDSSFLENLYDLRVNAGMNRRYHQILSQRWYWVDRLFKILTGIVAAISCIYSFATWGTTYSQVTSIIAAALAVSLSVLPFGEWSQIHKDLFRRWNDLLEDSEVFRLKIENHPSVEQSIRFQELTSKMHRIDSEEPAPWQKLLDKCFRDEETSRLEP